MLLASLLFASAVPSRGADLQGPRPRVVDPARAKAQEGDRQRLLAKLRGDAPKVEDEPVPKNPLDAPIFHRHDRR
jgi:hypothetical protein